MRKMDRDGLMLCELQVSVFEQSVKKTNTSSEIFIRRFMHSEIARLFDSGAVLDDRTDVQNVFDEIEEEYGVSIYYKNDKLAKSIKYLSKLRQ